MPKEKGLRNRKEGKQTPDTSPPSSSQIGTPAKNAQEVKKAESKLQKILTRTFFGALMIGVFVALIYAGHLYVCLLVALIQVSSMSVLSLLNLHL